MLTPCTCTCTWLLLLLCSCSRSAPACPVLAGPVIPQKNGIRAARCLSEASLRRPPFFWGSAGCPKRSEGTRTVGSPFFCLLFFGEAKKSELPPGNPGQQNHEKPIQ